MMRSTRLGFEMRISLGALALLLCASQGFAVLGVWRRTARRTTAVVAGTAAVAATTSAVAHESAAAQQSAAAETAAAQSAAAASQASAAAAQAAAATSAAPAPAAPASTQKTPQQRLAELQSLYKQGLISESDYNTAKTKILAELSQ